MIEQAKIYKCIKGDYVNLRSHDGGGAKLRVMVLLCILLFGVLNPKMEESFRLHTPGGVHKGGYGSFVHIVCFPRYFGVLNPKIKEFF